MMIRVATLSLLLLAGSVHSHAAETAGAVASSATTSVSRERLARIDSLLQRYVDEERIAGAVALVLHNGQPVYHKAFGWSDREAGRKMSTDTIFRIASQTKALTSAAALMLMEEGRLALGNPVSQFIPEFAKTQVATQSEKGVVLVAANRPVTIRDLLTHTSGYSYGVQPHVASLYEGKGLGPAAGYGWYFADKNELICESMARLASLPTLSHPGEAYVYGYSTDILGCVVERASGMSLDAFIRSRLLEPLGMKDTHFYLPPARRDRLAAVYASNADGKAARAPDGARGQGHYADGPRRSFSGGAGLLSTTTDYARFLEMIRQGGTLDGVRYLSPRAVALMRTNQVGELHSPQGLGFGYGFQTVERFGANGMDAPGAYGWGGAYGSMYRVDPASGLTTLLMIQIIPNTTDLREKFLASVYQALGE